jgi:spore coat polysaccharide biosynthesis protein SpsF
MTRVGIVTQARTTSTRLPGKVLLEVAGKSLLEHHLDRLRTSGLAAFVATTTNSTDDRVVEVAEASGATVHRGSEDDVLSRFHDCALENALDVVVRVTSDCPLVDGAIIADAVEDFLAASDPRLYLSNTLERTFPRGLDFEVFSASALTEAAARATGSAREHVTPYFYANPASRMNLRNVAWPVDRSHYRVTVDTSDDFEVVRSLIEEHGAAELPCAGIIELLDRHPEVASLNQHVQQKHTGDDVTRTQRTVRPLARRTGRDAPPTARADQR